jgi:hypothetical protein
VRAALAGGFRVVGLGPEERVGAAHLVLQGLSGVGVDDLLPIHSAGPQPGRSAADAHEERRVETE